ncbi:PilW family protein [Ideonella sp.]|uniref:PilW family protein n=1 Tax=Ideonella sp. TaxID=1929293 RepID=UPI002B498E7E|nr:PilW family protein [Ideonella sp.]HJV68322.1 PilW family protein [Ideonella sp.]
MNVRPDLFLARRQRGLTLIELMVALVIGMVLTVAVFGVLAAWEGKKRVTTGLNDLEQAGNLALYELDQWVRSAGSGFSSTAGAGNSAYGCLLRASAESGQTLPRTSALAAPFASVDLDGDGNFPLLPAMIVPDATTPGESGQPSDALLVMGGSAHHGGAALSLSADPTDTTLRLDNTVGVSADELLLLFDPSVGNRCLLTQVASSAATSLTLDVDGSFYAATVDDTSIASSFKKEGLVLPIGSPTTDPPQFQLIGVGDHNTLYSYDLLQSGGADVALQARAEGVFEMHALYGVDNDGNGTIDEWVSAGSGSDYAASKLMAGTPTARTLILRIKAVRVGLILRTTLPEKTAEETSTPSMLYLFRDLGDGLRYERALSGDALKYRYRVMEATLVLRNNMAIKG